MPQSVKNFVYNSERWDALTLRDDDIIIATPAKCGTTWTQMLVALLVFDTADLPAPLSRLSPWLDMNTRPLDEVIKELDAQTHRRFIKTHLSLSALPQSDSVTYITVGRDPRDVALSWNHHYNNMDMANFVQERADAVGLDDLADLSPQRPPAADLPTQDAFWAWIEGSGDSLTTLAGMVGHLAEFWERRDDPNVVLLHYADMERDLVGQMALLAERLGLDRSRQRLEELAPAAAFAAMKESAHQTAPNADQTFWKNTGDFFHKGSSGQWRDVMTAEDLPRYEAALLNVAPPEMAAWLHHGTSQRPA